MKSLPPPLATDRHVRFAVPASDATPILCGPLYAATRKPRFVVPALAILAGATLFSSVPSARAATKYWEPTGSTGTNASGTWNTSSASWTTDSTGATGPNTTFGNSTFTGTYSSGTTSGTYTSTAANQAVLADDAVFSADPAITGVSTVTLGANIGANSVTFGNAGVTNGGAAVGFTFAAGNILTIGSYTVSGANTYTGNTVLTMNAGAGPVIFNNQVNLANGLPDAAGSSTINYSIANNSSNALTFNGFFAANTRPNNTNDTVNLTFSGTGGVTFNGAISGNTLGPNGNPGLSAVGGNVNLIINGGGAVALNAANVALGSVALSNGTLTVGNSLAMQGLALNQTGGTFSFGTLTAATIGGLTGTSTLTLTNSGGAGVVLSDAGFSGNANTVAPNPTFAGGINGLGSLTINGVEKGGSGTGGTATFSGVLSFTGAGGLTINDTPLAGGNASGASTVVLTNANTYTGPTTVTLPGGSLTLNGNGSIAGTSAITLNSGIVAGSTTPGSTTLVYDNTVNGTASRLGTAPITLNGGTLNYRAVTTGTNVAGTGSAGAITVGGASNSAFNTTNATGTGNTSNFTIASLVNTNHGTLTANLPFANANIGFITLTAAPALINGILPWTYESSNGNFLSVNASNQLNAYSNVGTDATTFNNTASSNVQLAAATTTTPTAAVAENSLIVNFNGTQPLGGQTLTLTSGGLVFKTATGVLGSTANDGFLTTAAANPELYINAAANGTINAAITNAGGTAVALTKFGTGTLSLAGTNTYTGPTTVEQGTLALLSGSAVSSTATVQPGATLTNLGTLGGLVLTPGSNATLFGTSVTGPITLNGTLTLPAASNAFTAGTISGTGGTGIISYSNTNTVGNSFNFSNAGTALASVTSNAGAGPLNLNYLGGANTVTTLTNNSTAGALNVNTNGSSTLAITTVNGASGSTVRFGGDGTGSTNITNPVSTAGQLFDVTAGTVTLNSEQNVAEAFQVDGGTLIFNTTRYSNNVSNTFTINGGTVQFNANGSIGLRANGNNGATGGGTAGLTFTGSQTGGTLSILTNGATNGLSLGSTSGTDTTTYNLSGGLISGSGAYIDLGADTAGTSTTTFNLSGGRILIGGTIEGAQGASAKQAFVWTGGTLAVNAFNATNLTSTSGTAVSATTNTLTNAGTGILAPGDTGTAGRTQITGNYAVSNPTTSNAALAVDIGGANQANAFQNTTASASYDLTTVSGTTTLGGRLNVGLINGFTPTAAQTFTVLTSTGAISGNFNNYQVAKSGAANVIAAGGTGSFSVAVPTAAGSVVLSNFVAGNTYTGNSTAWDAATAASWSVYDPGSSTTLATPVASGAVAVFGNGDTTAGVATVPLNSTRNVAGILFNSTNTGATNYTISQSGSGSIVLDNTANGAMATINDTSTSGNANMVNVPIALNSPTSTFVNPGNTLTLGGAISGAQMLTKNGGGILILGSANTYTGPTIVSTGTLLVNGSTAAGSAVSVTNGGTLGGIGTAAGPVTVATGGQITGAGVGTVGMLTLSSTGPTALNGGSTFLVDIAGATSDNLKLGGLLSIATGANLTFSGIPTASTYDLANYTSETGMFNVTNLPSGYALSYGATELDLVAVAVPEPSTWVGGLLLLLGGLGLKLRRRKSQVT